MKEYSENAKSYGVDMSVCQPHKHKAHFIIMMPGRSNMKGGTKQTCKLSGLEQRREAVVFPRSEEPCIVHKPRYGVAFEVHFRHLLDNTERSKLGAFHS